MPLALTNTRDSLNETQQPVWVESMQACTTFELEPNTQGRSTPPLAFRSSTESEKNDPVLEDLLRSIVHDRKPLQTRVLPKRYYLEQLRHEQLRADRSGLSFSVLVIRVNTREDSSTSYVPAFLDLVHRSARETDTLGYLGDHVFGLILPYTSKETAQIVLGRLLEEGKHLSLSVVTHTYPDTLFELLSEECSNAERTIPPFLDYSHRADFFRSFLKRAVDVFGALVGIVLSFPVLLFTSIAIKLDSRGPVVVKQVRVGKNLVPFVLYKFRSMRTGADDRVHHEYTSAFIKGDLGTCNQGHSSEPLFKMTSDDRITPVGRIIRKWSIDELPQLFNVLKGDMSLVGARPPLPYEVEKYEWWHLRRILELKPGITGLWQVQGRSRSTFEEMVRLDLRYSRECSMRLDFQLLINTIKVVLRARGAA